MPNAAAVRPNDPPYLRAAFSVLGLSEIAGARHEKRVLAMYPASGHPEIHDDETPWCAAYIGWSLEEGGLTGTHSLLAISYAKYGAALDRNKRIPRGAIAVWKRTGGNHVNFVLDDDGTYVTCLGGNQDNRRGGGVTISRRRKDEALAYRMPPGVSVPKPAPLPPKPAPKPAPKPVEPEPETELPDPEIPLPRPRPQPDEEPVEDEKPAATKPSFFRRAMNWVGGLAASAASVALDWRFGVVVVGLIILAVAFLLWLYGKEPIKAFISRHLGMGK